MAAAGTKVNFVATPVFAVTLPGSERSLSNVTRSRLRRRDAAAGVVRSVRTAFGPCDEAI